jgi:integrase
MDTTHTTAKGPRGSKSRNENGCESRYRWGSVSEPSRVRRARGHGRGNAQPPMDQSKVTAALQALLAEMGGPEEEHPLADALDRYESNLVRHVLKQPTVDAYRRASKELRQRFGDLPLRSTDFAIAATDLYAIRGSSAELYLKVLRSTLLLAIALGWRSAPHGIGKVLRRCKYQPREACFDEPQLVRFLQACEELDRSGHFGEVAREVLRALVFTGCRVSEVARLHVDEVGPGYLKLRDSKTGPRTVPINAQAQLVIGRQRVVNGLVFPGRSGRSPITTRTVEKQFHVVREAAGLREGVVHSLRHSFSSVAARNGVQLKVLQSILGHANASHITMLYLHPTRQDCERATAVVANAIGGAR